MSRLDANAGAVGVDLLARRNTRLPLGALSEMTGFTLLVGELVLDQIPHAIERVAAKRGNADTLPRAFELWRREAIDMSIDAWRARERRDEGGNAGFAPATRRCPGPWSEAVDPRATARWPPWTTSARCAACAGVSTWRVSTVEDLCRALGLGSMSARLEASGAHQGE